jgi:hypothetical protein
MLFMRYKKMSKSYIMNNLKPQEEAMVEKAKQMMQDGSPFGANVSFRILALNCIKDWLKNKEHNQEIYRTLIK